MGFIQKSLPYSAAVINGTATYTITFPTGSTPIIKALSITAKASNAGPTSVLITDNYNGAIVYYDPSVSPGDEVGFFATGAQIVSQSITPVYTLTLVGGGAGRIYVIFSYADTQGSIIPYGYEPFIAATGAVTTNTTILTGTNGSVDIIKGLWLFTQTGVSVGGAVQFTDSATSTTIELNDFAGLHLLIVFFKELRIHKK